jgi:Excreted virulence factor EspC, type VII ESX diderm
VLEGRELLDHHFGLDREADDDSYVRAAEFRENAIRLIIFDVHLAIEDLLKWFLHRRLAEESALDESEDIRYVKEMSSRSAIDLSARLGVIDAELHDALVELNALRNRAGHTWALDSPELTHKARRSAGNYPLRWKGKRLTPHTVRETFLPLYGGIYLNMFKEYLDAMPAHED